jgi:uncharacterized protein YbaR (Trm112 family)
MDPKLLAILVCPVCKAKLEKKANELICTKCKLAYPIDDGIPVMLIDQAQKYEDE